MRLIHDPNANVADHDLVRKLVRTNGGRIAVLALEGIVETPLHRLERGRTRIAFHCSSVEDDDLTEIVDAVGVVGMIMCPDHGVEAARTGIKQLLAQIRRGVDENARLIRLDDDRGPATSVLGLVGVTLPPVVADARHARRRAGPQQADPHARAFVKRLKKLEVVVAIS